MEARRRAGSESGHALRFAFARDGIRFRVRQGLFNRGLQIAELAATVKTLASKAVRVHGLAANNSRTSAASFKGTGGRFTAIPWGVFTYPLRDYEAEHAEQNGKRGHALKITPQLYNL